MGRALAATKCRQPAIPVGITRGLFAVAGLFVIRADRLFPAPRPTQD